MSDDKPKWGTLDNVNWIKSTDDPNNQKYNVTVYGIDSVQEIEMEGPVAKLVYNPSPDQKIAPIPSIQESGWTVKVCYKPIGECGCEESND